MLEASASPRLPGISVSGVTKVVAIIYGVIVLVGFVPLALLATLSFITMGLAQGGHLPWPGLQWVLTTPLGVLLLTVLCLLIIAPTNIFLSLWQLRSQVARAIDITDYPPAWWYGLWPAYPQQLSFQRWFGNGRREQALNLALLILGILLVLALIGALFVSAVYALGATHTSCGSGGNGCTSYYPFIAIVVASGYAAPALSWVARVFWLRHVETTGRIWLRYRSWFNAQFYYVRQPGVVPETAAAVLARFSYTYPVPWIRVLFFAVLALTPFMLLASASFVLSGWLQQFR